MDLKNTGNISHNYQRRTQYTHARPGRAVPCVFLVFVFETVIDEPMAKLILEARDRAPSRLHAKSTEASDYARGARRGPMDRQPEALPGPEQRLP